MEKELTIKSAGLIDGRYKVVLSNDMELGYVTSLRLEKDLDDPGYIVIHLSIPQCFRELINIYGIP